MAQTKTQPDGELSQVRHDVRVSRLAQSGDGIRVEWDEGQRKAVADFLAVVSIDRFAAQITASPFGRGGAAFRGTIEAEIVQESIVTLEPVRQIVRESFARTFLPEGSSLLRPTIDEAGEMELDPEGEDSPDPFTGDTVDLGAVLVETLALAVDPYPRGDSEAFEDEAPPPEDEKVSPFAALAALKTDGSSR